MKRLIVIIKILLSTIVGFGCPSGALNSFFHSKTEFEIFQEPSYILDTLPSYTIEPTFENPDILNSHQSILVVLDSKIYPPVNNGGLYMLLSAGGHRNVCYTALQKLKVRNEPIRVKSNI